MKRSYPLHLHISTLFIILILVIAGAISGVSFKLSRDIIESTADDLTARINREVSSDFSALISPAEIAVSLLGHSAVVNAKNLDERLPRLGLFTEILKHSEALSSIYVGYDDGDFLLVRNLRNASDRLFFKAPAEALFMAQSIERNIATPRARFIFLDTNLKILREENHPEQLEHYDPRARDWYSRAISKGGSIITEPYFFFANHKIGNTFSTPAPNGHAVIGADILLETLSASLTKQKITPSRQIALANQNGFVIAHGDTSTLNEAPKAQDANLSMRRLSEFGSPILSALEATVKTMTRGTPYAKQLRLDNEEWHIFISSVTHEDVPPLYLVLAIPDSELLAPALKLRTISIVVTLIIILLAIPLTWMMAHKIAGALRELESDAQAVRDLEFDRPQAAYSLVKEVNDLAMTMTGMKQSIRRFLDIFHAAAAEKDFDRLLALLLKEMIASVEAKAGIFYRLDQDMLIPTVFISPDGTPIASELHNIPLPTSRAIFEQALREVNPQALKLNADDITALGLSTAITQLNTEQGVAVPLVNRQNYLVGAMLLLREKPTSNAQLSFIRAFSGSAAGALETRGLIKAQKDLFESFIQLIAGTIDAKSPYTGGHCARVPVLTKMLAKAADEQVEGPFKDFKLNEDEWDAVHVASWLHDCGKITTPEYVVDKSTKLETIYDRIHEIRMRFEVLKRDAEINALRAQLDGQTADKARAALTETLRQIDDDFAFVASCNEGGEFLAPEKIERLKTIAAKTWVRTLDDRIGIAHEEKERKAQSPASSLPTTENLLADKPEHLFARRANEIIAPDNKWGFKMKVPPLRLNKGELYNLSIARGTLTEEERYKINEHIVQTLIMLAQLPFPKHLRAVPEIAGGHHEKMDGTGYPKGLHKDEMSPVARMMAIADIFEALTAIDRPYKKGKSLSESIKIMSFMKKDHHIDPDLFDLFLRSGIYREYAERYMKPEQIDEFDISVYLTPLA